MPKAYKTVTQQSKRALKNPEGLDVDYKSDLSGLETEDLVAFANSVDGGIILVGVQELETNEGQKGKIIGCEVRDQDIQKIINKAESCSPPIEVEITLENLSKKPIIKIAIPSGSNKPYSTQRGVYKIRGDGQNIPLSPSRLLNLLLEQEGEIFIERFQSATKALAQEIDFLDNRIQQIGENMMDVGAMAEESQLNSESTLEIYELLSNDVADKKGKLVDPWIIQNIDARINAVIKKLDIEDPVRLANKRSLRLMFEYYYDAYKDKQDEFILIMANYFPHLTEDEFSALYDEVMLEYLSK